MENLIRIDDDFQKRKRNRMNKGIFGFKKMNTLDLQVEKFIAWVEGRYTPRTEEEEAELYAYGERVYPYLMELQHHNR